MTFMQGLLTFVVGYYLHVAEPFKKWKKWHVALAYTCVLILYVGERFAFQRLEVEHSWADTGRCYMLSNGGFVFFIFYKNKDKLELILENI